MKTLKKQTQKAKVIKALAHKVESVAIVPCQLVEGSTQIVVAGHEFHFGTQNGRYRYWYCKYKRAYPKTCNAVCRKEIDSKDLSHIELVKKHRESPSSDQASVYFRNN